MGTFQFVATPKDWDGLIKVILDRPEFSIIPDIAYRTRKVKVFQRESQQLRRCLTKAHAVYIAGAFTSQKTSFQAVSDGRYWIEQETSGEMLRLSMPAQERKSRRVLLGWNSFSYPKLFWNVDLTRSRQPSSELKSAYSNLIGQFKSRLVRIRVDLSMWVGEDALNKLTRGEASVLVKGWWWTFENGIACRRQRERIESLPKVEIDTQPTRPCFQQTRAMK